MTVVIAALFLWASVATLAAQHYRIRFIAWRRESGKWRRRALALGIGAAALAGIAYWMHRRRP